MKNLENYGVLEMDAIEARETDGGLLGWTLGHSDEYKDWWHGFWDGLVGTEAH